MSLLDIFKAQKNLGTIQSAQMAKNRLQILVAQDRSQWSGPDYLPVLRRELLEVITKYVDVDADDSDAVTISLIRDGTSEVLDITVILPETVSV